MDPETTCPECGQSLPDPVNRFSTGSRSGNPNLHLPVHEADGTVDPEGPLGHAIYTRLREQQQVGAIQNALDVSRDQVAAVAEFYDLALPQPSLPAYTRPGGSVPGHVAIESPDLVLARHRTARPTEEH